MEARLKNRRYSREPRPQMGRNLSASLLQLKLPTPRLDRGAYDFRFAEEICSGFRRVTE